MIATVLRSLLPEYTGWQIPIEDLVQALSDGVARKLANKRIHVDGHPTYNVLNDRAARRNLDRFLLVGDHRLEKNADLRERLDLVVREYQQQLY